MKFKFLCLVLIFFGWALPSFAQTCPSWSEKPALLRFLHDNKSHSLAADPACVDRAFATLSHDNSYNQALIGLLDFERSTKQDDRLLGPSSQYPAIGALAKSSAVPYLIAAVKNNDSELIQKNAAEALTLLYRGCPQVVTEMLEAEAEKSDVNGDQQGHLRTAAEYIAAKYSEFPCKSRKPEE